MNKREIVVYVSGPFRAPTAYGIYRNIRSAEAVALRLWKAGYTALCPHLNTANFQGELPDTCWLDGDLVLLGKCQAIVMCPGWRTSEGATKEYDSAVTLGLPVFDVETQTVIAGPRPAWLPKRL